MNLYLSAALIFIFLSNHVLSADSDKVINLATVDYCPLMCDPSTEPLGRKGIMVEIAEEIFSQHGLQIKINFMPLSRGMREAEIGNYDGYLGGDIHQAPKLIYPLHPLTNNHARLFVRKDFNWQYQGIESLSKIKLLAVKGFSYANKQLDNYLIKAEESNILLITGERPSERGIEMLRAKKADAMLEGHLVFHYYHNLEKRNRTQDFDSRGPVFGIFKNYLSFSPKHPAAHRWASIIDHEMPKLIESGRINAIYQRYGIPVD